MGYCRVLLLLPVVCALSQVALIIVENSYKITHFIALNKTEYICSALTWNLRKLWIAQRKLEIPSLAGIEHKLAQT